MTTDAVTKQYVDAVGDQSDAVGAGKVLSSSGAAAALRGARMRWNLLWVNVRTGSAETRHAAYDSLDLMVAAIERGIAQYGDEFDVKRCFYGTEVELDINMVVRVALRAAGGAP